MTIRIILIGTMHYGCKRYEKESNLWTDFQKENGVT